ncbi:MAG: hypothetical protein JF588_21070 [Caulobacterales bacterium]|nr:hypothetical protein [Caulobacterales bacterium]
MSARVSDCLVGLALLCAVLICLAFEAPAALDFPNHYVRLWLIGGGAKISPSLDAFYAIDWSRAGVNIGGDLLVRALALILGPDLPPRLLLAIAVVVPPLGAIVMNRGLFGGGHWWGLAAAALAWQRTALAGFMNFQLAIGLALVAAALETGVWRTSLLVKSLVRAAITCGLLLFHPFGPLMYLCVLMGLSVGAPLRDLLTIAHWRAKAPTLLITAAAVIIPFALVVALVPNPIPPADRLATWGALSPSHVYSVITTGLQTYSSHVDLATLMALVGVASAAMLFGKVEFHAGLVLVGALLLIVSPLAPEQLGGTGWVDRRLPVMGTLILVSAIRPRIPDLRFAVAAAAALLLSVAVRSAVVARAWASADRDERSVEAALGSAPAGARIISAADDPPRLNIAPPGRYLRGQPMYWNFASLALRWRGDFVPNVFTQAGQQPLRVQPRFAPISTPSGGPPSVETLSAPKLTDREYVRLWRQCFQYVLVMNADIAPPADRRQAAPGLQLVNDQGFAVLYRNPSSDWPSCQRAIAAQPAASGGGVRP